MFKWNIATEEFWPFQERPLHSILSKPGKQGIQTQISRLLIFDNSKVKKNYFFLNHKDCNVFQMDIFPLFRFGNFTQNNIQRIFKNTFLLFKALKIKNHLERVSHLILVFGFQMLGFFWFPQKLSKKAWSLKQSEILIATSDSQGNKKEKQSNYQFCTCWRSWKFR